MDIKLIKLIKQPMYCRYSIIRKKIKERLFLIFYENKYLNPHKKCKKTKRLTIYMCINFFQFTTKSKTSNHQSGADTFGQRKPSSYNLFQNEASTSIQSRFQKLLHACFCPLEKRKPYWAPLNASRERQLTQAIAAGFFLFVCTYR